MVYGWMEDRSTIVRPFHNETPGAPVLFPKWALPQLRELPEGKGGGVVVQKYRHAVLRLSVSSPFELADADTPEMLATLEGLCHD